MSKDKPTWAGATVYKGDFEDLVRKEASRMKRVMHSLPLVTHASIEPCFEKIERRARISVYGRLIADGATLEGV